MGYNRSQDITPYLGHGELDKHRLIMAFSGLRSDFLLAHPPLSMPPEAMRHHHTSRPASVFLMAAGRKDERRRTVEFLSSHQAVAGRLLQLKKTDQKLLQIYVCGCELASARLVGLIGIRQHPPAEHSPEICLSD